MMAKSFLTLDYHYIRPYYKSDEFHRLLGTSEDEFYDHLNEAWIQQSDHPVALLRAENATRIPWIT